MEAENKGGVLGLINEPRNTPKELTQIERLEHFLSYLDDCEQINLTSFDEEIKEYWNDATLYKSKDLEIVKRIIKNGLLEYIKTNKQ